MGFGKINVQELQGWFCFGLGLGLGVAARVWRYTTRPKPIFIITKQVHHIRTDYHRMNSYYRIRQIRSVLLFANITIYTYIINHNLF